MRTNIHTKRRDLAEPANQPEDYENLTREEKLILNYWIQDCLEPYQRKTFNPYGPSSYGLKHRFQYSSQGFYLTNGQFKGAMLAAGFEPHDKTKLNWTYRLGKKAGVKRELTLPIA